MELSDCALPSNVASDGEGDVLFTDGSSTIRFLDCSFLGDYADDRCIVNADYSSKALEFHRTKAFESGLVCSAIPVLVYNSKTAIPLTDDSASVTCQAENIAEYCQFDCSSGTAEDNGGITCR